MDRVVISTELPEVTGLKSRLLAVEAERDAARTELASEKSLHDTTISERNTAEAHLRDCRARCERMRTMEGLPLDECAARQLHAEAQRDAAQAGQRRACEVIQNLLDSAYPHPVEHLGMFKAWREARTFLEGGSIALVADTVEPLALSAERLLAELGVTEPGAGEDNHEMPVAGLMDKLYEAWNNYMRAKHGQADAIFEPEGE